VQLLQHPRLADSRLPDHEQDLAAAGCHVVDSCPQPRKLRLAVGERPPRAGAIRLLRANEP
jgi:hypothetical protein